MEKVFVADDKFEDVITILERHGWIRSSHADSPNFMLKWRNLSKINFRIIRSDQFVNHVFNSQQLSNKALLAGHLAFYRNHDDGDGDDDNDDESAACDEPERLGHREPGSFFPSCWDVSSGQPQLSSLQGGFAVSAAVALVRDFLHEEGMRKTSDRETHEGIQVIENAVLLLSSYAEALRHCTSQPRKKLAIKSWGHLRRRTCVRPAADLSLSVGDSRWVSIMQAWEARIPGEDNLTDDDHEMRVEAMAKILPAGGVDAPGNPPSSLADRARGVLREVADVDPQASLMGRANAWIVKPVGQSCGRGISVTSSWSALLSKCRELGMKAVVQKYIERPLLVQGFKFDIRQWVLVTSVNPLVIWGFDECYIRFSSSPFSMNTTTLADRYIHLCNHAVQRDRVADATRPRPPFPLSALEANDAGVSGGRGVPGDERGAGVDGLESAGSQGSMWSAQQFQMYLAQRFQGRDVYEEVILPSIRSVVLQTLLCVRDALEMKARAIEWLGFDLMVTHELRVMLLEVNVSPDVSHSTRVTARLVPRATEGALRLLLSDGGADATMWGNRARQHHPGHPPTGAVRSHTSERKTTPERVKSLGEDRELSWRLWYKGKVFHDCLCFLAGNGALGGVMGYFFSCFVLRRIHGLVFRVPNMLSSRSLVLLERTININSSPLVLVYVS